MLFFCPVRIYHSLRHRLHAPPLEFHVDRMAPCSDVPERAEAIRSALCAAGHEPIDVDVPIDDAYLLAVHAPDYVAFLRAAWPAWDARGGALSGLIPYTFAVRDLSRRPDDVVHQAGWYGFDPQTPIVAGTYEAARSAAACALAAADGLLAGERAAYALCRPPGHHAGRALYGGYCYFNNAAIAAARLASRVAILDIDYHHGNGTQAIYYDTDRVLYVSIHADPDRRYPFFSGASSETGSGRGLGFTLNIPLGADVDDGGYLAALDTAFSRIHDFHPDHLVVSAGYDICESDPLGDFRVTLDGLEEIGRRVASLDRPTLVVQEGGYNTAELGACAVSFVRGLAGP